MVHRSTSQNTLRFIISIGLFFAVSAQAAPVQAVTRAGFVVIGTGTAASCTSAAVVAGVVGGGIVTFNCGPAPVTIPVSVTLSLPNNTYLDGGGKITLDGEAIAFPLLRTAGSVLSATVTNITVTHAVVGIGSIGAITVSNVAVHGNLYSGISLGAFAQNGAKLLLQNSRVFSNGLDAGGATAGVNAQFPASIRIINSEIYRNFGTRAGGIYASASSSLSISNSQIYNNRAEATTLAAGIVADDQLAITDSAIFSNSGGRVGGLRFASNFVGKLTNTTLSGNSGTEVGGIDIINGFNPKGGLALTHVTLKDNAAITPTLSTVASVRVLPPSAVTPTLTVSNTVIMNSPAQQACSGTIVSYGGNFGNDSSCGLTATSDISATDALLEPLTPFAGFTAGHLPAPNSPLLDAANNAACVPSDQRGLSRPQGLSCDIGALEFEPTPGTLVLTQFSDPETGVLQSGQTLTRTIVASSSVGTGPVLPFTLTLGTIGSAQNVMAVSPVVQANTPTELVWTSLGMPPGTIQTYTVLLRAPSIASPTVFTHTIQADSLSLGSVSLPESAYTVIPHRNYIPLARKP